MRFVVEVVTLDGVPVFLEALQKTLAHVFAKKSDKWTRSR
jgi:hypothetical protein